MKVVSAAPLLPRSSFSIWTSTSWPSLQGLLDRRAPRGLLGMLGEIAARHLLEREEAVPVGAIIDERRLEAGLDAGDPPLVDIGLLLFPAGGLYIEVVELLPVNDRNAQLFGLGCVDQHSFHGVLFVAFAASPEGRAERPRPPPWHRARVNVELGLWSTVPLPRTCGSAQGPPAPAGRAVDRTARTLPPRGGLARGPGQDLG